MSIHNWKSLAKRKSHRASATQVETFRLCNRKWWLGSIRKLRQPATGASVYGTVLHDVCARYLEADDLGYDKKGNPVDLFPEGWTHAINRYTGESEGEVSPDEADTIKKLITAAIDAGVLERLNGRSVEQEFHLLIVNHRGTSMQMIGFIDICYPDAIDDHKTSKNKKYFLSKKKLKESPQMLIYARAVLEAARERGGAIPSQITLRHRQYCKNPADPVIRKTEVTVTPAEIDRHWQQVEEDARRMSDIRRSANSWRDIPDPSNTSVSCNAYGGCPYKSICSGHISEEVYQVRLDKQLALANDPDAQAKRKAVQQILGSSPKETSTMNFTEKLAGLKNRTVAPGKSGASASVNPPKTETAEKTVQTPASAEITAPVTAAVVDAGQNTDEALTAPPWADSSCAVCAGVGFNAVGKPCRICDMKAKKNKVPTSAEFTMDTLGEGTVVWQSNSDPTTYGESPLANLEEKKQPVVVEEKTEIAAPETTVETPNTEDTSLEEAATTDKTSGRGRPKKGFILCLNCAPVRGMDRKGSSRYVYWLHDILEDIGNQMVEDFNKERPASKVESFYDIDVFVRRDAMAKYAVSICAGFKTDIVCATLIGTGASDLRSLFDAIRPLAGMELAGMVG